MSGFRMRRGSSTAWTAANPVLGEGEFGYDLNASLFKIGNGVSSWTQLPYYSSGGGAADGFNRLAAGTQTAGTNTTVVFANSNGLTFGMSGSSQITASHNGLTTARASNDGIGLNTAATNVTWTVNSNGLSLNAGGYAGTTSGFAGNLISGSMTHNTAGLNLSLNHPAWLTTAAQSNHSHGNPTLALTNLSGTTASNSNGLTLSLSAAAGGGGADGFNILAAGTQTAGTATTVNFGNSNGITFGMSGSSQITASHNGLTTAALSNHSHGVTLNLTNLSGTTGGNSNGITLSLSAAAQSVQTQNMVSVQGSTGNISLANSNGITFGFNASTITASHNGLTSQSNQALSGSNGSFTFQTATFGNLNGVSFYTSNGSLVASHNGLTTARASNDGVGLATALTAGPLAWTVNSAGLSLNAGSAAGTTSGFAGNLISGSMTHNTAGLNLSLNHPAWLTTAAQSNHSHGNPTLALTNISGTTASNSNGLTLSLSAAAPGGGGGVFSGIIDNGGATTVTPDLNGNIILAPGNDRLEFEYDSAVSRIRITGFAPWVGISTQGNTSGTTGILSNGSLVLVGGNNITLSQATGAGGNTITISGGAGGGGNTESYRPLVPVAILNTQTYQISQSTSIVWPVDVQNNESVGFVRYLVSASATSMASLATTINTSLAYSQAGTFRLVAYTRGTGASSQSLQSIASTSWSTGQGVTLTANTTGSQYSVSNAYSFPNTATASTSFSTSYAASVTNFQVSSTHLTALTAAKIQGVPWNTLLPPERIWFAFGVSTTSGSTGNASISNGGRLNTSGLGMSQVNLPYGDFGAAANASVHAVSGVGSFTTAGGGSTASLGFSNISSSASHIVPYFSVGRIV